MIIFTNGRFGRMYEAILKQRNENGWSDDMLPDLEKIIGGKHMSESDFTRSLKQTKGKVKCWKMANIHFQ